MKKLKRGWKTAWGRDESLLLCELWQEGHSASEIGKRLGKTRNAVIGKAYRLFLPERRERAVKRMAPKRQYSALPFLAKDAKAIYGAPRLVADKFLKETAAVKGRFE